MKKFQKIKEIHPLGDQESVYYKNDKNKKNGLDKVFWIGVCLSSEAIYLKGLLDGLNKMYYSHDDKMAIETFDNDQLHGINIEF